MFIIVYCWFEFNDCFTYHTQFYFDPRCCKFYSDFTSDINVTVFGAASRIWLVVGVKIIGRIVFWVSLVILNNCVACVVWALQLDRIFPWWFILIDWLAEISSDIFEIRTRVKDIIRLLLHLIYLENLRQKTDFGISSFCSSLIFS